LVALGKKFQRATKYRAGEVAVISQLVTLKCVVHLQGTDIAFERRHCGLARQFKTDSTETIALCFGYPKRAEGSCLLEQMNRPIASCRY
jgi:hypothetical protein